MRGVAARVHTWGEMIKFSHSLFALPFALLATFLAARPAPLRYEVMTPGFLDRGAEIEAIRTLREKNVRLIFMFNRPTPEFGAKIFGRDYYRTLMEWIESNYEVDAVFGDGATPDAQIGDVSFFIKCYRKKDRPNLRTSVDGVRFLTGRN